MLVNKEKRIIVLQNPKTGGQFKANQIVGNNSGFMRKHVMNYFRKDGSNHNVIFPFHITYNELREYLGDDFQNWNICTIVRNPYDRVSSAINFRRKNLAQMYKVEDDSFEGALSLIEQHREILYPLYDTIWFAAQSFWMGEGVDILKYESEDDWRKLDSILGISNSSVRIRKSYDLSDSVKSRIKGLYYDLDKKLFEIYKI